MESTMPQIQPALGHPISSSSETLPKQVDHTQQPVKGRNKYLLGLSKQQLQKLALRSAQKNYRGKQLHDLLYKAKGNDINKFLQLPQSFRECLQTENWKVGRSQIYQTIASSDGTLKVLLMLEDCKIIEAVGIPVEEARGINQLTVCVSSQAGCPLMCSFCATGKGGYSRNLKVHEIVDQVLTIEQLFQHKVSNVIFMGMGEPMLNLSAVLAAHRSLNEDIGIRQHLMTISTVGIPNTILRLAQHKLKSTLSVSLHAANQKLREMIVPSAKSYHIEALMADCKKYSSITDRKLSFEYTLLAGINDEEYHAIELADLLYNWGLRCSVNLTLYNPILDSDYRRPFQSKAMAFKKILTERGLFASIQPSRGLDANAGLGQLKNDFQKFPLRDSSARFQTERS